MRFLPGARALRTGLGLVPIFLVSLGIAPPGHAQFSEEDRVTAEVFDDGDQHGHAVAMWGDYAIVGAPRTNMLGPNSGAAYILERDAGGAWTIAEKLYPTDTGADPSPLAGNFGWSVDIQSTTSGTFALVGAPQQSTPGPFSVTRGAAYLYERTASGWSLVTKLLPPDPADNEEFGWSVALSGTFVVVGAPAESSVAIASGTAYVFIKVSGVWQLDSQLIGSGLQQSSRFGTDIDILGTDVIVGGVGGGLPCCPAPASVHVFHGTLNPGMPISYSWSETATFLPTDVSSVSIGIIPPGTTRVAAVGVGGATGVLLYENLTAPPVQIAPPPPLDSTDAFGDSVHLASDGNAIILAVGAPLDDAAGNDAGRVHLYQRTSSTFWGPVDVLVAGGAAAGDEWGRAVAVSGFGGDRRVIAGAPFVDVDGFESGAAAIFEDSASVWAEVTQPLPYDDDPSDRFGESVAIDGTQMLVGAPGDDGAKLDGGSLYAFDKVAGVWTPAEKVVHPTGPTLADGDDFATAIAIDGDLAIVGAPFDDSGGTDAGAVYFYERVGGVWTPNPYGDKLVVADATAGARFGASVDIEGDLAIVGAPGANAAYILGRANAWIELDKLQGVTPGLEPAGFGSSVALRGDRAIIGDPGENTAGNPNFFRAGGAYVFADLGGLLGWTQEAHLSPPPPGTTAIRFGESVAIDGVFAVVGAPHFASTAGGGAFVWRRTGTTWSQMAELARPSPLTGAEFGHSVDISGLLIAVGEAGAVDPGTAWVFQRAGTGFALLDSLPISAGVTGDGHGASVAIQGVQVAVGAPGAIFGLTDAGAVTTYLPEPSVTASLIAGAAALVWLANAARRWPTSR